MRVGAKSIAALAAGAVMTAAVLVPGVARADDDRDGDRGRQEGRRACPGRGRGLVVTGLTGDGALVCFKENDADEPRTIGQVTGLVTDTKLVGIDYRPADGSLVGLGDAGGVYTIHPGTAEASLLSRLNTGTPPTPLALSGTSFGVDFNPTVDRLRVVSDTGQNLRINVDTGATIVDGSLNNGATPPVAGSAAGAAYTNNDLDPSTATTLFDISAASDQVFVQVPPNAGTLSPTGALGVDATPDVGFDIYSTLRGGRTVDVDGFAVLTVGGRSGFYEISLLSGFADLEDIFPTTVVDIAIPLDQR